MLKQADGRFCARDGDFASGYGEDSVPPDCPITPNLQRAFPLTPDDQLVDSRFAVLLNALSRAGDREL